MPLPITKPILLEHNAQNSAKTAIGRPFKKGQSGNPGGRPRTAELGKTIRAFLAAPMPGNHNKTRLDALIERLYQRDPKTLLAYAFGKPVEMHEAVGLNDRSIHVVWPTTVDPTEITGEVPKPTVEQVRRWIAEDEAALAMMKNGHNERNDGNRTALGNEAD